jgi:hypothetical protein
MIDKQIALNYKAIFCQLFSSITVKVTIDLPKRYIFLNVERQVHISAAKIRRHEAVHKIK